MVLWLWPWFAALGFRALPLDRAVISSCIAGFLLLPSNINVDLPGLPDLSKQSVVSLGIVLTYLNHHRRGRHCLFPAG
ncbi:hypothetical protein ACFSLT_03850 [Novosphingobium resinovorum]